MFVKIGNHIVAISEIISVEYNTVYWDATVRGKRTVKQYEIICKLKDESQRLATFALESYFNVTKTELEQSLLRTQVINAQPAQPLNPRYYLKPQEPERNRYQKLFDQIKVDI